MHSIEVVHTASFVNNQMLRHLICSTGFSEVCINQGVGDVNIFIISIQARLSDINIQEWYTNVKSSDKLRTYVGFKYILEREKYIDCVNCQIHRIALARFRCSSHDLRIETGRRDNIPVN